MSTEILANTPQQDTAYVGASPLRSYVHYDIGPLYPLSIFIAFLVAAVALAGLLFSHELYLADEILYAFLPVDLFHLLVGVPVLLGATLLARRGSLVGLLAWPGALLYVLYSYITNLLGVPFGWLFLPYLLLVTLSLFTTIALVASIDARAVHRRLRSRAPARAAAALLLGLTSLFVVMNVSAILSALIMHQPQQPQHPLFVLIADFTTVIPLCLVGGFLLWRGAALGYTAATGLLLFYAMLLMGLVPVLVFPYLYDGAPIAVTDTVLMFTFGAVCLFLFAHFMRAAAPHDEVVKPSS